ncbi:glutathione-dependent formaldehyde-activating enzyme [Xylaria bambusicola]|uniref:glutathione-dependent formaldehyde-activating enzyme n=1 Tax=Xylaria bambusicola TaxID=326684 RepID=UPI0020077226|nr:glutathione-dependent formaldehyde-activating enzyme [Xylaria bambusicola]KAI0509722.1 glutathione-dependent formaldehyde-activating enzyme [Xylaria bambusicola]
MTDQEAPLKTYRANCHCAAYVYEVTLPEISTASQCNCSVCYKKGALWVFPKPEDVKFVKGDPATLTNYTFGKKVFVHKFCSTCGNSIMFIGNPDPSEPGEHAEVEMGINIRLFQHGQIDIWKLLLKKFDGASLLQPPYEPPVYSGPEPVVMFDGSKLYTGSCHCGAVTLALKNKAPLNHSSEKIIECNCSSCVRAGYVWVYPSKPQVIIEGRENLGMYFFGKKHSGKTFCKICGVPVHNELVEPSTEELAAMTDEEKIKRLGGISLSPINLRVIHDLNVNDLSVYQFDGYSIFQPPYVEP